MELFDTICGRRSIRAFTDREVPEEMVRAVIEAGMQAPSSKNRQPWHFTIVRGASKAGMLSRMEQGILREQTGVSRLPGSARHLAGAEYTAAIMKQAPVTIFISNPLGLDLSEPLDMEQRFYEMANLQSVGAAIQNMSLAAHALGIGSLWICDIYFAYEELQSWIGGQGQLAAALSLGYPDESPGKRPRRKLEDIVRWI
ncbi:nitroreductase family protein [Candidatus Soleaferrea massiliensis]|uniref:nitroreductase family protein n=1 Tax=Candidatus Soleaferrea massiliensis TaxID=1470354 RepID=UPI00058DBB61|nr:nitroreductase [Candidatus Soleaferrea massiliensis]